MTLSSYTLTPTEAHPTPPHPRPPAPSQRAWRARRRQQSRQVPQPWSRPRGSPASPPHRPPPGVEPRDGFNLRQGFQDDTRKMYIWQKLKFTLQADQLPEIFGPHAVPLIGSNLAFTTSLASASCPGLVHKAASCTSSWSSSGIMSATPAAPRRRVEV